MKELVVTTKEETFIFITKDEEEFTLEEATEYISNRKSKIVSGETVVPIGNFECSMPMSKTTNEGRMGSWRIPNDKMRRHLFRKDLQNGIDFCVSKYGQPKEIIEAEAQRLSVGGF